MLKLGGGWEAVEAALGDRRRPNRPAGFHSPLGDQAALATSSPSRRSRRAISPSALRRSTSCSLRCSAKRAPLPVRELATEPEAGVRVEFQAGLCSGVLEALESPDDAADLVLGQPPTRRPQSRGGLPWPAARPPGHTSRS